MSDARRWDERYRAAPGSGEPARVLLENRHLLPERGRALDLACGLGANSLLLAEQGLQVSAWDFSEVAIERLRAAAGERGLSVAAEVRDVTARPPAADSFEVVVVSRFLDRTLIPQLIDALTGGGVIFYQTFLKNALEEDVGPRNPVLRLGRNELLELFRPLHILFYREERNEAMLVGGKLPL